MLPTRDHKSREALDGKRQPDQIVRRGDWALEHSGEPGDRARSEETRARSTAEIDPHQRRRQPIDRRGLERLAPHGHLEECPAPAKTATVSATMSSVWALTPTRTDGDLPEPRGGGAKRLALP